MTNAYRGTVKPNLSGHLCIGEEEIVFMEPALENHIWACQDSLEDPARQPLYETPKLQRSMWCNNNGGNSDSKQWEWKSSRNRDAKWLFNKWKVTTRKMAFHRTTAYGTIPGDKSIVMRLVWWVADIADVRTQRRVNAGCHRTVRRAVGGNMPKHVHYA